MGEHLEPVPLTYLAGSYCDSEGQNCEACPGPDEDYNMWDNLFIHPGDETGAGRYFIHALSAVLFIMLAVLVCTYWRRGGGTRASTRLMACIRIRWSLDIR